MANSLERVAPGDALFVLHTGAPPAFEAPTYVPLRRTIGIADGWNLVGFTGPGGTRIAEFLADVAVRNAFVFDRTTGLWAGYVPGLPDELQAIATLETLDTIFLFAESPGAVTIDEAVPTEPGVLVASAPVGTAQTGDDIFRPTFVGGKAIFDAGLVTEAFVGITIPGGPEVLIPAASLAPLGCVQVCLISGLDPGLPPLPGGFSPLPAFLVSAAPSPVGGVNESPTAADQEYASIGNAGISPDFAQGLLNGATDPNLPGQTLSVNSFDATSSSGGAVDVSADGAFTYTPPPGFTGMDTFTYTLQDDFDPPGVSPAATVEISVSDLIWFIDNTAGGTGGAGTLADPFRTIGDFNASATVQSGDAVYLAETGTPYDQGVVLQDGQQLIGEGATGGSLDSVLGLSLPTYSVALPATGGIAPTINSADTGISLAQDNTIRGLNIGDANDHAVAGTNVGNLTISDLQIDNTTSGAGLVLSGGGTVTATGTNTITTTTGTAVDITGTAIETSDITFESISAGAAAGSEGAGIVLSNTGNNGGLTVTGTGTAGSGGTIRNKTGADGSTSAGIGIFLNQTADVSLSDMQLNNFDNFAIRGTSVVNFSLHNSTISGTNGTSAAAAEGSVRFDNLTGAATFADDQISGGVADNLVVTNASGTLNRMTVSGGTIGLNSISLGNDGVRVEAQGSARLNLTVTGVSFRCARGDMIQANAVGSSAMDVVITDNTFNNTHPAILSGGGGITLSGGGAAASITYTYEISGSTPGAQSFRGALGNAITVNFVSGAGTVIGAIRNNDIGATGVAGSGSMQGSGIAVGVSQNMTHITTIDSNRIRGVDGFAGIDLAANTNATLNATISNNVITELGGFAFSALYILFGGAGSETGTANSAISNNVLDAGGAMSGSNAVTFDQISTLGHHNLPGYAGTGTGESGALCTAGTASGDIGGYLAGRGNTMTNGAFPAVAGSGVDATLVCGVTGDP